MSERDNAVSEGSGGVSPPNVGRNVGQDAPPPLSPLPSNVGQDAPPPLPPNVEHDAPPPLILANLSLPVATHANHLPHWQQGEAAQFVTWRLGDSLPREKLDLWKHEKDCWMRAHPEPRDERTIKEYHRLFGDRLEEWLDAGAGSCILRNPDHRRIVEDAFRHFDGQRYNLWAFVIMPNHVHALFSLRPPHLLEQVLHSWKSFTAKKINRQLGKRKGVWQEDYWDRLVRSQMHYERFVEYIRENPEKARLSAGEYALYVKERSGGVASLNVACLNVELNVGQDAPPPLQDVPPPLCEE